MSTTLSQRIVKTLTEEIVKGELLPGEKLDEQALADRFEVSRSPIRDALRVLAATRLVEQKPRRGFSVATIDTQALRSLFEASSEIEGLCAQYCALRADAVERETIRQRCEQGAQAVLQKETAEYPRINRELHLAIYNACHNDALRDIALDVRHRLSIFRARFLFSTERIAQSQQEHEIIVKHILAHDAEGASTAMKQHVAKTAMNVIGHLEAANKAKDIA